MREANLSTAAAHWLVENASHIHLVFQPHSTSIALAGLVCSSAESIQLKRCRLVCLLGSLAAHQTQLSVEQTLCFSVIAMLVRQLRGKLTDRALRCWVLNTAMPFERAACRNALCVLIEHVPHVYGVSHAHGAHCLHAC